MTTKLVTKSIPQKKSRDPEKTRAYILQVAFMEIYQKGFQGVGIRDIAKKANLTIGAFFHHFPTKNDVAYAIVEEIIREGIMDRWIKPLAAYKNPIQGILKCFKKTFETWPDEYVALGCPLNNLTQEMTHVDPGIRQRTQAVLNDWIDETEKYIRKAQQDGYLKKNEDAREIAEFVVTLQEGTFAMGKALSNRRIFDSMYQSLKSYLDSKTQG